jgi:hypothetical protein
MEWVKLHTRYYLDRAVLRAGEAAEVLFTRSLAYAGDQESDGFIPAEALAMLAPKKGATRAAALVREGLWDVVDGGWQIPGWIKHQVTVERLEQKREAGRTRVARHRARQKTGRNGVTNAVSNEVVRSGEVEEEVEDAAAAASKPPLPPSLEILKAHCDATKLTVRWDRLTAEHQAEIEHLIDVHGDAALAKSALQQHRADHPAVFAQAWLPGWRALVAPGTGLHLVTDPPCPKHEAQGGTTRHCASCAADRLAGDA